MVRRNFGRVFQGCLFSFDFPDVSLYDIGSLIEGYTDRSFIRYHKSDSGLFHMHFVCSINELVSCVGFAALVGCRPDDLTYCSSFETVKKFIINHVKESRDS